MRHLAKREVHAGQEDGEEVHATDLLQEDAAGSVSTCRLWTEGGKRVRSRGSNTEHLHPQGPLECHDKVKTVISENPVENCDMEPLRTCKHVTKLVPKLDTVKDCVDVPKEICAMSKVNPRRVKKPSIQKWCFSPEENSIVLDVQSAQGRQ